MNEKIMAQNSSEIAMIDNTIIFPFERSFSSRAAQQFMQKYWHLSFYICTVYIVTIFGIQRYMASREKLELRRALFIWNLLLAVFSTTGLTRTLPEFYSDVRERGFAHTVCSNDHPQYVGFWVFAFIFSKLPELGDTIFVVLRKQKLLFLHWYHHVTVLLFCWYSYQQYFAPGRWYMNMNFFVHSVMYSYYALKSIRVKVPRWASKTITRLQVLQMVMALFISGCAFVYRLGIFQNGNNTCHASRFTSFLAVIMYSSYFILFVRLYRRLYVLKDHDH